MALLWFSSLPLAITNRNADALIVYAAGLILSGFLLWRIGNGLHRIFARLESV